MTIIDEKNTMNGAKLRKIFGEMSTMRREMLRGIQILGKRRGIIIPMLILKNYFVVYLARQWTNIIHSISL